MNLKEQVEALEDAGVIKFPTSFDNHRSNITATYLSLLSSIDKAGGGGSSFSIKGLSKMSALELLLTIGPNKIRFTYNGKIK